jgi:hypothetical protein
MYTVLILKFISAVCQYWVKSLECHYLNDLKYVNIFLYEKNFWNKYVVYFPLKCVDSRFLEKKKKRKKSRMYKAVQVKEISETI